MITELPPEQFSRVQPLIAHSNVPAQAVLARLAPGRIFADRAEQPTAAFVWNEFRYCYLVGDSTNYDFLTDLSRLLHEELFPEARQSHDPTIVFYPDTPGWVDHIPQLAPDIHRVMKQRQKFTFVSEQFSVQDWQALIPNGLQVKPIDNDLAEELIKPLAGIVWHSVETYLEHGFGYCVMDGNTIASSCFTVFAAHHHVEISIETHPDYRQQGLATLCGAAFITHCLEHNIEPVWECWHNNMPSMQLAAKLGFRKAEAQPICFVDLTRAS